MISWFCGISIPRFLSCFLKLYSIVSWSRGRFIRNYCKYFYVMSLLHKNHGRESCENSLKSLQFKIKFRCIKGKKLSLLAPGMMGDIRLLGLPCGGWSTCETWILSWGRVILPWWLSEKTNELLPLVKKTVIKDEKEKRKKFRI